ncbi:MAG: tetratricopeptide repeat-containing glycosyltransferase family protein [Magnetospirillum sp.]|nr:tetratricopeptide repeat-containing glycosyltransferase family protein [Magnetospirillum sp.]
MMDVAVLLLEQARRLERDGLLPQAELVYRKLLADDPGQAGAAHALGNLLYERGAFSDAAEYYRQALGRRADYPEAAYNLGNALGGLGRWLDAAAAYDDAIRLNPDFAEARLNRAGTLHRLGRHGEAADECRRVIDLREDLPDAYNILGASLYSQGDFNAAVTALRQAIALCPDHALAHNNLGMALSSLGRFTEAAEAHRRALALDPDMASAYTNLARPLYQLGRIDEALAAASMATALAPKSPEAHNNLGTALYASERNAEAAAALETAIAMVPDLAGIHHHYGMVLLKLGRLAEGWAQYEWRRRIENFCRQLPGPQWRGEPLGGRTILLHTEQGLGDCLHFARYAPLVAAAGGRVVLWADEPLVRILRTLPGVAEVVPLETIPPTFDVHLPLMSLPHVFGTELHSIPADIPYLLPDAAAAKAWGDRLTALPGLKVGLVWAGGLRPYDPLANFRSLGPDGFASLASTPGVSFVSLQKGPRAEPAEAAPTGLRLTDWMDEVSDFADTAALIANLDLVITVDTAVAHLAGAMGKPVWVLLRFGGCWRWLESRDDSPWYPTARLFRQPALGQWEPVLLAVADELRRLTA